MNNQQLAAQSRNETLPGSQNFEPVARVLAATAMAQSLSYSLRRQYLEDDAVDSSLVRLVASGANLPSPSWLQVEQVGLPVNNDLSECMIALERVLQTAHVPGKYQLIFLVVGDGVINRMYLGLRPMLYIAGEDCSEAITALSDFGAANWPGLRLKQCAENDVGLTLVPNLLTKRHCGIVSFTGLPALRRGNLTTYPATMDRLMGALLGKQWAYIVVADPLPTGDVDGFLDACRDLAGRVEAMKVFNFSESIQTGQSEAFSKAQSDFENWSRSEGTSEKAWDSAAGKVLLGIGASLLVDSLLPGMGMVSSLLVSQLGKAGASRVMGMAPRGFGLALEAFVPSVTQNDTKSGGTSTQESFTKTYSDSQSHTLSQTFVNKHMEAVAQTLNHHITRFEQSHASGCWQVGAYLITEDMTDSQSCGRLLRSLVSGDESYHEPVRLHEISSLNRQVLDQSLRYYENPNIRIVSPGKDIPLPHPLGEHYQKLRTPMNTKELAMFINLPTRSVPGIDVLEIPDEASQRARPVGPNSLIIGHQLYSGAITEIPYPLEIEQLVKHTLVCGITGSGKTTTCKRILNELLSHKVDNQVVPIPFLVIEPAKEEYVEWAFEQNDKFSSGINVFIPGRTTWRDHKLAPFVLNPFDIVWLDENKEPRVLEHIDRLKTIINAALPMQEILPVLMEELVYRVYQVSLKQQDGMHYRWLPYSKSSRFPLPEMRRPSFSQLAVHVDRVVSEKGYQDQVAGNLKAALNTRIESFKRGWRATVLDQPEPTPELWKLLFDRPTIINLSALSSDDDKAFFMAVLLQFLYEYRQAQYEYEKTHGAQDLRHLVVIEEAHRILVNTPQQGMASADPRGKVAEMFSNMISEIRAYGQGLLIADQIPGRLNPDAIKNTNLKIVHRLVAADDKSMMSTCLDLKPSHSHLLGSLRPGQALVRGDLDNEVAWVEIERE